MQNRSLLIDTIQVMLYSDCIMKPALTVKQKLLFQIIKEYQRKHGVSPTLGELQKMLGVPFMNSVVVLIKSLEEKGYITREKGAERGIEPVVHSGAGTINVPVVGAVACGKPLLAQENVEGYISVDKNLLHNNPKDYFFLRALGDSMDKAGIDDGDMVLIKSQRTARPDEKVVALIDDEATIKVYKPYSGYVALVPKSSNSANKPIILHENFAIQGIVKAVFKKDMLTA